MFYYFCNGTAPTEIYTYCHTFPHTTLFRSEPVPSLMTSNPMRGVMCQANAAATPMSASTPSHSSHNPPLLTGRNGTVVTPILQSFSCPAFPGANIAPAYRRREIGRASRRDRVCQYV